MLSLCLVILLSSCNPGPYSNKVEYKFQTEQKVCLFEKVEAIITKRDYYYVEGQVMPGYWAQYVTHTNEIKEVFILEDKITKECK